MTKKIAVLGVGAIGSSVGESGNYLRAEMTKWAKVIREAGIKVN